MNPEKIKDVVVIGRCSALTTLPPSTLRDTAQAVFRQFGPHALTKTDLSNLATLVAYEHRHLVSIWTSCDGSTLYESMWRCVCVLYLAFFFYDRRIGIRKFAENMSRVEFERRVLLSMMLLSPCLMSINRFFI